jgi:hypothetical protein
MLRSLLGINPVGYAPIFLSDFWLFRTSVPDQLIFSVSIYRWACVISYLLSLLYNSWSPLYLSDGGRSCTASYISSAFISIRFDFSFLQFSLCENSLFLDENGPPIDHQKLIFVAKYSILSPNMCITTAATVLSLPLSPHIYFWNTSKYHSFELLHRFIPRILPFTTPVPLSSYTSKYHSSAFLHRFFQRTNPPLRHSVPPSFLISKNPLSEVLHRFLQLIVP